MKKAKLLYYTLTNTAFLSIRSILSCLGSILTISAVANLCNFNLNPNIYSIAIVTLAWWLIDGYCISQFLKWQIVIHDKSSDTEIMLKFGDVFNQTGWIVIPVNDFFDSQVDDKHVAKSSLHGIHLNKYWGANSADWDRQAQAQLDESMIAPEHVPRNTTKTKRYPIGTTLAISCRSHDFLCVALSRTNHNMETQAHSEDLIRAVRCAMKKARTVCAGQSLNFPLVGSGLSRVGLPPNLLIQLILIGVIEEAKESKITNNICIILPIEKANKLLLTALRKLWS